MTGDVRDKVLVSVVTLRKQALDSFDNRRSYEWKISLALWAGIGTLAGFLFPNRTILHTVAPGWFAAVLFTSIVLVYGLAWSPQVARRQLADLWQAEEYRHAAEDLITGNDVTDFSSKMVTYRQGLFDFASYTKTLITACFFVMAWLALYG